MTNVIQLPFEWDPRPHQRKSWAAMRSGNKRVVLVAHRRFGKDELFMRHGSACMFERPGTYWHMLPKYEQCRKAIWEAVNEETGRRRVDEIFPRELFGKRENDMLIRCRYNDATWQLVGSDNYDSLVGSPPVGVTFSEYPLSHPAAWAYLSPILERNGGWAGFAYTPRGENHGYELYQLAKSEPGWYCELATADNTGLFTREQLARIKRQLIKLYRSKELGTAYFEQEYRCSFSAPILGAVFGEAMEKAERDGRITRVRHNKSLEVHVSFDIGYSDKVAIWFGQITHGQLKFIDYHEENQKDVAYYAREILDARKDECGYCYADRIWLPHDAKAKLMGAKGRSIQSQFSDYGYESEIVRRQGEKIQHHAGRQALACAWFDREKCRDGIAALRNYAYKWDEKIQALSRVPEHNWASDGAKSFMYFAMKWVEPRQLRGKKPAPEYGTADWWFGRDRWEELMEESRDSELIM